MPDEGHIAATHLPHRSDRVASRLVMLVHSKLDAMMITRIQPQTLLLRPFRWSLWAYEAFDSAAGAFIKATAGTGP